MVFHFVIFRTRQHWLVSMAAALAGVVWGAVIGWSARSDPLPIALLLGALGFSGGSTVYWSYELERLRHPDDKRLRWKMVGAAILGLLLSAVLIVGGFREHAELIAVGLCLVGLGAIQLIRSLRRRAASDSTAVTEPRTSLRRP